MTEFDGSQEPDFDDPSYAEIQALLAGARVTEPVPADVAASLEATLADLVAARQDESVVVPLRRRTSWSSRLLAAAAAVIVVGGGGVGLKQVFDTTSAQNDSKASADSNVPAALAEDGGTTTGSGTSEPPAVANGTADEMKTYSYLNRAVDVRFTRAHFARQATRFVNATDNLSFKADVPQAVGPAPAAGDSATEDPDHFDSGDPVTEPNAGSTGSGTTGAESGRTSALAQLLDARSPNRRCPGPEITDASVVLRITFGRQPAVLVVHPEFVWGRLVVAWSCDGSRVLASTTVVP